MATISQRNAVFDAIKAKAVSKFPPFVMAEVTTEELLEFVDVAVAAYEKHAPVAPKKGK